VDRGIVSSASSSSVTDSSASFGDLTTNPHSVVIVTGTGRGEAFPISSNTATQINVTGTLPTLVGGDEFEIVPDWTLNSVFGTTNSAGLQGATSSSSADNILVFNSAGAPVKYWYKTGGIGGTGWRTTSDSTTNQGNARLGAFNFGMVIDRQTAPGDKTIHLQGTARSGRQVVSIASGSRIYSYPFAKDTTLAGSGLQSVLAGSTSSSGADIVFLESNGVITKYWFKTGGIGGTGWRTTSDSTTDRGSVVIAAGKAMLIERKTTATNYPVSE
jgi:hypothetical protein